MPLDEREVPVAALAVQIRAHAALRTSFALDGVDGVRARDRRGPRRGHPHDRRGAPPRGGRPRRRWAGPVIAVGAAGLLAGATLIGRRGKRPRVVEATLLGRPEGRHRHALGDRGNGGRSYEVRDARGNVVAHGSLPAAAGTMDVENPGAAGLRVAVADAFGSDARDAVYARATPRPRSASATRRPASRASRSTRRGPTRGVTVRYAAHARDLHLAVVDGNARRGPARRRRTGAAASQIPAPPPGPREPYLLVARADGSDAREETACRSRRPCSRRPVAVAERVPRAGDRCATATATRTAAPIEPTVLEGAGGDRFAIAPDPAVPGRQSWSACRPVEGARVQIVRDRDGVEIAAPTCAAANAARS